MKTVARIIVVTIGLGISAMANPAPLQPNATTANDAMMMPNDPKQINVTQLGQAAEQHQTADQSQSTDDDQQDNAFFGKPGSTKRWCWYIGSGVVLVITATAIYLYYRGDQAPQPPSNPVVPPSQPTQRQSTAVTTQTQPTPPTPTDQACSTPAPTPLAIAPTQTVSPRTATPPQPPIQPTTVAQPIGDVIPTQDDENWGDFDTGSALSTLRQQTVLTAEDTQALDKNLEAMTNQADAAEHSWLKSRRFETLNPAQKRNIARFLRQHRTASPGLSTLPPPSDHSKT
jgi:hypothetical protein